MTASTLDAVEIMTDLVSELHHHVHVPGCKCNLAIRKLRHAMAHVRPIHWAGAKRGACPRLDSGVDAITIQCGEASITHSGVASHSGNVTCPVCKAAWKADTK